MQSLLGKLLTKLSYVGSLRNKLNSHILISLTANLLPFQVEGFSWMRHQEVKCPEIRGGILADEMGKSNYLKTLYTVLYIRLLTINHF